MRAFSKFRVLALAATLSAPLTPVALAQQQPPQQQALSPTAGGGAGQFNAGPYGSDANLSPPIGE